MPETIESFVKKLQLEGIAAGEQAAERIKEQAELEAEKIVSEARAEAGEILSRARDEADTRLSRAKTELELIVRDTTLKLRESISRALSAILNLETEKQLSDPHYLGEIIREVITAYAGADAKEHPRIEINLPPDMYDRLRDNVLKDMVRDFGEDRDLIGLKATLNRAGFEYRVRGATVEVSPESVTELISELAGPALREILDGIAGSGKKET